MNAPASPRFPRERAAEPGPVVDCADCRFWHPGPVVVRGSTAGWCERFSATVPADFSCDEHSRHDGLPPWAVKAAAHA